MANASLFPFLVDLHVHTVLSPCAGLDMGAPEIVSQALQEGLSIIAITDHNSSENWQAIQDVAADRLLVLPGIEVQTAEDVHILCIFETIESTRKFQEKLWKRMPYTPNNPDIFGDQLVIDKDNNIVSSEEILLVQGVGYEIDQVIQMAHALGGLAILAHIDRPGFSYTANLGPIPRDYDVDALELSKRISREQAQKWRENYPHHTFLKNSDSHSIDTINRNHTTKMFLAERTFKELRSALRKEQGRSVIFPWE